MNEPVMRSKLYNQLMDEPNKLFRQMVEESRTGVYIADNQGNLVYVNSSFVGILGYTRKEDLLGRNLAQELYVNPNDRRAFLKAMDKVGFVRDYEVRNRRRDDSIVFLSVTSSWIKDDANNVIGIEGMVHDITEKKKIEESFIQEKEELKQILNFEERLSLIHRVDALSDFAVEQMAGILKAAKCSLMLYDRHKGDLFIQAAKGLDRTLFSTVRKKLGEPIAGIVAQKREPVLVKNIDYDKAFKAARPAAYATRSFVSAPVIFGPRLLGIINVSDKLSGGAFNEVDLKMLCVMARAVGIALENADLFERLEILSEGEPWHSLVHRY